MHTFKLLSAFFKVNVQMALAYRADTIVNILLNVMWLGWELLSLNIIFSNTTTLGGWGLGELIALLGVFRLVNTMMIALIWPNTEKFNQSIRDGSMDYTILHALLDSGRYPVTVYPAWLRIIVTFVIPIAVATTIPLQALRGDLNIQQIVTFFMVAVVSFIVASQVWKRGLKQYSGASS